MRRFKTFVILALALFLVAPAADAAFKDMWASVYTWDGTTNKDGEMELVEVTTNIRYKVLQAGSDTAETLYEYGDQLYTSMTNPVTTTNFASSSVSQCGGGKVCFKVDPGEDDDTDVDLIVNHTAGGFTKVVKGFTQYDHTIIIDERPNIVHQGVIWYTADSGVETSAGFDFNYDTIVYSVRVETVTEGSGETLDVGTDSSGTNGDADGFIDGVSTATAGYTVLSASTLGAFIDDGTSNLNKAIMSADEQTLTYYSWDGETARGYLHYTFSYNR